MSQSVRDRVPKESALIACLFAGAPTGIYYGFSLYSESLKIRLGLTDAQTLNIAAAPALMAFFGPLWGNLAQRMGPRIAFLVGGSIMLIVQSSIYTVARFKLRYASITLPLLNAITMVGTGLITAFYATLPVQHYQRRRGEATSLVKSFVGLSGAAVAQLFYLIFPHVQKSSSDCLNVILIWMGVTVVCCAVGAFLVPAASEADPSRESFARLRLLWWLLLGWGLCTTAVSLQEVLFKDDVLQKLLGIFMLVLLACPLLILVWWNHRGEQHSAIVYNEAFESEAKSFTQMIVTPDAWLIFIAASAVIGGGQVISTSMSQILTAGGNNSNVALVLAQTWYSTGNMLGRLTVMGPSDFFVHKGIPRPCFVLIILMSMAVAHLLFLLLPSSSGSDGLIAAGSLIAGLSFGSMFPHMVVLASELFGSRNLSTNYMMFDGGSSFVSYAVFAKLLAGGVEGAHTHGRKDCAGADCFRLTHIVVIATNLFAMMGILLVAFRSRGLYLQILRAHRGIQAAGTEDHTDPAATVDTKRLVLLS